MKSKNTVSIMLQVGFTLGLISGCLPLSDERVELLAQKRFDSLTEPLPITAANNDQIKKSDLAEIQLLRMSGRDFSFLDPALAYGSDWELVNQVLPGLTRLDMKNKKFLPFIAEKWEVSPDGLVWTFSLRQNIPWVTWDEEAGRVVEVKDNGDNTRFVTSNDFRTGILRALNPTTASGNAFALYPIQGAMDFNIGINDANAVGVTAPDAYTLVIQLDEPNSSLDAIAEMPVFSAVPSWLTDLEEPLEFAYGPYLVKENMPDIQIRLTRNPFWPVESELAQPMLEEIVFNLNHSQDVLSDFKNGNVDLVRLHPEEISSVQADPQLSGSLRYTAGACGYYLVFFNADTAPLNTPYTRQAVAEAIDTQKLSDLLAPGEGLQLGHYAPDFLRGSSDQQSNTNNASDSQSANQKESEIDLSDEPLVLASPDTGVYLQIAEAIRQEIQDNTGFEVVIDTYPWENYIKGVRSNYINSGMYLMGYCLDYADAQNLWDRWLDRDFFVDITNMNWSSLQFTDALLQAKTSIDPKERTDLFSQAEQIIINDETVIIPLFWRRDAWLINPKLSAPEWLLYPQLENWALLR